MSQDLINRYQQGGDIYASLVKQYGQPTADAAAQAALSGDETQINAVLASGKYGAPLNTSTWDIFGNELETDPLAAPLASANTVVGNTFFSLLKNPWVIFAAGVIIFGAMGGFGWLGRKVFSK